MRKLLVLGGTGYIGEAFMKVAPGLKWEAHCLSRRVLDYTRFPTIKKALEDLRPSLVVNAAGYSGKPNVDACERAKTETLTGNSILPITLSQACELFNIPFGHVSSGCIYSGAWILHPDGGRTLEPNLMKAEVQPVWRDHPERVEGFSETDPSNFNFDHPPCSFYSGAKALAETCLKGNPNTFLWRLRIPFDSIAHPKNYLTKLLGYPKVYNNVNSISNRFDFVRACLELYDLGAPFGVYNITNPGFVSADQVVATIKQIIKPRREFVFWENDEAFYREAAKTPRSNCVLSTTKLDQAGVKLRPVSEAIELALREYKTTGALR